MKIIIGFIAILVLVSCQTNNTIEITSYGDGPYVFDQQDSSLVIFQHHDYTFDSLKIAKSDLPKVQFVCEFDSIACPPLQFSLQGNFVKDADTISMPEKVIAMADIEGNFERYYQLLVANHVMDSSYNWMFGNGHLILVGDLVDRGDYVTQCLWLTYHLEQQAAQHGGKVHYLMGNHEQLVLLGYDAYSAPKYLEIYKTLQKDVATLYGVDSEFGKWMRSKNAILKAGDIVFDHGGISTDILKYNLTFDKINSEIQRDIDTREFKTDESTMLLTTMGVLWYRGLVKDYKKYSKISEEDLDKILDFFNCKSIQLGILLLIVSQQISMEK